MNNQPESNHMSNIDTNISSINSNINNMYSILNIISNTILINQRQTLLNELRTPPPPPPRTNLFSNMSPLFTYPNFRSHSTQMPSTQMPSTQMPATQMPTQMPSTQMPTQMPSTQMPSTQMPTQIPSMPSNISNTTQVPPRSRDSLNSFFSSLLRNEIPSGHGIGNMEISVMGLNIPNEEENLVISHHNIFNNTKIKLFTSNEEDEEATIEQCSICLADIEHNQIMREITKCKHIFHVDCADKWFDEHIKCPNCRQDIRIDIVN